MPGNMSYLKHAMIKKNICHGPKNAPKVKKNTTNKKYCLQWILYFTNGFQENCATAFKKKKKARKKNPPEKNVPFFLQTLCVKPPRRAITLKKKHMNTLIVKMDDTMAKSISKWLM